MILKRLRTRFGIPVALMAVLALAVPAGASAFGLGEIAEFSAPTEPTKPLALVKGSDGNIWYTNEGATKLGRTTPSGEVTEYSPAGMTGAAQGIAAGPDGNIWFTEPSAKKVGYIKPGEPESSLKEFTTLGTPGFITAGPDGNLWVTLGTGGVAKVTPAGVVSEFSTGGSNVCSITAGPDGNVWYGTCNAPRRVGKITPSGEFTQFEVAGSLAVQPNSIALGSDGRLWFPTNKAADEKIGAITTGGVITYYKTPTIPASFAVSSLTAGPDGNIWGKETSTENERQTVKITATGGKYKLCTDETKVSCTTELAFNASTAEIKAALEGLYGAGNITEVTEGEPGLWSVLFGGTLVKTNLAQMGCKNGTPALEGTCEIATLFNGFAQRLFRFLTSGEVGTSTGFELKQTTALQLGKTNTLASGPDNSLWYTASNGAPKAIGKFGLGIELPELTVVKEGTGSGTVVSSPAGIECGGTCKAEFAKEAKVTLTASPSAGSTFVSWKGCEKGGVNGRQCTVTMDKSKTVNAKFLLAYDVAVNRVGSGLGKVSSSPGGVLCLSNCSSTSAAFKEGTSVTLTAAPSKHFTFTEWTGDCSGAGTCSLPTLSADKSVGAKFTEVAKFDLTVTKKGGGNGTVKAKQAGINCGATCSSMAAKYYEGEVIELLVPTPGKGSTFGGWSGAGCSGTGTCVVTMSSAKSVEAEFK